jgi:penicillin G amidase
MPPTISPTDLQNALPDVSSTLTLDGLQHPVEVIRDGWGIPHIRAETEQDAFFAQGLVTAQDRLWHMDYDRQRALGCWSALVGSAGLAEDKLMRTFGLEEAAKADFEVTAPAAQAMLTAYAAGVNAFISLTDSLPVEYKLVESRPQFWEPWHCLAVYKIRNMLMGTYEMKLWRARLALKLGAEAAAPLFRGYPDDNLVSVPPGETYGGLPLDSLDDLAAIAAELNWLGEVDGGSNAWVVSGEKTASGLPIVAGDSHRALDTPNVYYQIHITCPAFRFNGYAIPGVPGAPHFSHTASVAWGMTHGFADYQDLFIERFRSKNGRLEYEHQGEWLSATVSDEVLQVRNDDDQHHQVVRTQHGPIVAGDPAAGLGVAFCHTGTNAGTAWANTLYELLVATTADEAEQALREWTEPVNNFVYADVHGEFGYRYRGRIPQRAMANAWTPVPGWTGEHEWQGQIPFEELPRSRNPAAGFVVTCNNAPTTADYPHYINTYFAPDFRARRITARLAELPDRATIEDMASIHADRESIPAQAFVAQVTKLAPADERTRLARDILLAWDCRMDRTSAAAAIYGVARTYLFTNVIGSALGSMTDEALGATTGIGRGAATHAGQIYARGIAAMTDDDTSVLEPGQDWSSLITSALSDALGELEKRLGNDMTKWQWGAIHHTKPQHPLSRIFPELAELLDPQPQPTGGDSDTPQAGAYSIADRFVQTLMSVNRYIHDPADWRRSRWIVPLGASGHPGSPHFDDQAALWSGVQTIPQLWDWQDIVNAAETRQSLVPE